MSLSDQLLQRVAVRAGIHLTWRNMSGDHQPVGVETLRALLDVLGFPCQSDDDARDALAAFDAGVPTRSANGGMVIGRVGQPLALPTPGSAGAKVEVAFERGGVETMVSIPGIAGALTLPPLSQPGYHEVRTDTGVFIAAIAPRMCPGFADLTGKPSGWGLAAQVYSLGAGVECGVGDFGGVAALARASARQGADVLEISPVLSLLGAAERFDSPYAPSTRVFLDPVYADPHLVLPASLVNQALSELGRDNSTSGRDKWVNWPQARREKHALLAAVLPLLKASSLPQRAEFERYAEKAGDALRRHAVFEALRASRPDEWDWRRWPKELRSPDSPAVQTFALQHAGAVELHLFQQWLAQRSLAVAQAQARDAGMRVGLIADIPAGVDPAGGDIWARPDHYLQGATLGAPPDMFTTGGQDWRLTTFSPRALAASDYAPFLDIVRANLQFTGGMRMDHVMGVQRLWLIPEGMEGKRGAYVEFPAEALLRLIDLEAWRHRALVIGEDLGTLPTDFHQYLGSHGVLGTRFLRLERDADAWRPPQSWTTRAAALTTTHDTISTVGWWSGAEIEDGPGRDKQVQERARDRKLVWDAFVEAGAADGTEPPPQEGARAVDAAIAFVAATPCEVKLIALEDALAVDVQPNVPGTGDERPNWRLRYTSDPAKDLARPDVSRRLSCLSPGRQAGSSKSAAPDKSEHLVVGKPFRVADLAPPIDPNAAQVEFVARLHVPIHAHRHMYRFVLRHPHLAIGVFEQAAGRLVGLRLLRGYDVVERAPRRLRPSGR